MSAAVEEAEAAGAIWLAYSNGCALSPHGVAWYPVATSAARPAPMGMGRPSRAGLGSRNVVRVSRAGTRISSSIRRSNGL
jgi:hypothetical protein